MEKKKLEVYIPGSGQIVEKKSRFIGDVFSVHTEEEARDYVAGIKKTHYDARHHCFAYVLSDDNSARASDDGEPQGTAGKPILDVIKGEGLVNTLVVVTRYFGGTLLGTGGLTRAYREAAKEAIKATVFIEKFTGIKLTMVMDYTVSGGIDNYLRGLDDCYDIDVSYGEKVTRQVVAPKDQIPSIQKKLTDLSSGQVEILDMEELQYGIVDNRVIWL